MIGGGPNVSSPSLADIGKGRVWRWKQVAAVEKLVDGEWREIGRYRDPAGAGAALDERVGTGVDPQTLRIVLVPMSRTSRVLLTAAVVVGGLILATFAYILLVGG